MQPLKLIQQIKPSKPTNKLEWIILFSELIFVSSYILNNIILGLPFLRSVNFSPVEFTSYSIMCFGMVLGSISNVASLRIHSKRIFSLVTGIFLIVTPLMMCIFLYFWVPHTLQFKYFTPDKIAKLEVMLQDKKLDNKRKNLISTIIAEEKFSDNGERITIFDVNGKVTMYVPTESQLKTYNDKQRLLAVIPELKKKISALFFVLLLSVSCGLIIRNNVI